MDKINKTYLNVLKTNNGDIEKCIEFIDCTLNIVPIENIKEIDFWLDVRLLCMK